MFDGCPHLLHILSGTFQWKQLRGRVQRETLDSSVFSAGNNDKSYCTIFYSMEGGHSAFVYGLGLGIAIQSVQSLQFLYGFANNFHSSCPILF